MGLRTGIDLDKLIAARGKVLAGLPGETLYGNVADAGLPKGFRAELVACEPQVVDPVAMAFDEQGRLYVAEMRGYPNAGVATGSACCLRAFAKSTSVSLIVRSRCVTRCIRASLSSVCGSFVVSISFSIDPCNTARGVFNS